MYIGVLVKYPVFSSYFNEKLNFWQIFEKYSNIKCHENRFSGSRVVPCERTDTCKGGQTDRRTDMTKLTVAFRNFANAPKNGVTYACVYQVVSSTQVPWWQFCTRVSFLHVRVNQQRNWFASNVTGFIRYLRNYLKQQLSCYGRKYFNYLTPISLFITYFILFTSL
jgi:hypothetical protein